MEKKYITEYPDFDRFAFPEGICRVTGGLGGESFLIFGSEKTALYDTGMAWCHKPLTEHIRQELSKRGRTELDYILLSHSHYDHMGALPYLIDEWPEVQVCASAKARRVFASEGAARTMKRLGEEARDQFQESQEEIRTDGLRVDIVLEDGSQVCLGDRTFRVLETKGHTDCTLSYILEPDSILFASESTGQFRGPGVMHTAILKSYEDAFHSVEVCRACGARHILAPHYGMIPDEEVPKYFDLFLDTARAEIDFVCSCFRKGMDEKQTLEAFIDEYWFEDRGKYHPKAAFVENAGHTIHLIRKTFYEKENIL